MQGKRQVHARLLEAAMSQYGEANGVNSCSLTSAFQRAEQCWLPCRTKGDSVAGLKNLHCDAGQKASACALLEAAMRQYEEAIGLKSSAVTSAFRKAEQLLASLPDEDRQKVGLSRVCQYQ